MCILPHPECPPWYSFPIEVLTFLVHLTPTWLRNGELSTCSELKQRTHYVTTWKIHLYQIFPLAAPTGAETNLKQRTAPSQTKNHWSKVVKPLNQACLCSSVLLDAIRGRVSIQLNTSRCWKRNYLLYKLPTWFASFIYTFPKFNFLSQGGS